MIHQRCRTDQGAARTSRQLFCFSTETVLNGALVEKRRWDRKEIRHPFAPVCAICFSFPLKKRQKANVQTRNGTRVKNHWLWVFWLSLFFSWTFYLSPLRCPFFSFSILEKGLERLERGGHGLGLLFCSLLCFFFLWARNNSELDGEGKSRGKKEKVGAEFFLLTYP